MPTSAKMTAGSPFPAFSWEGVDGNWVTPANLDGWRMLIVYRGKHCGLCRQYLQQLTAMRQDFADAGVAFWAVSADSVEQARANAEEAGWDVPLLAGLTEEQMHALGLYISAPRSADEADHNFAEPGLFVINPQGDVQVIDISNAPFVRLDLKTVLSGIKFVATRDYPVRGTIA